MRLRPHQAAIACLLACALPLGCGRDAGQVVVDNRIATVQADSPAPPRLQAWRMRPLAEGLAQPASLAPLPQGGFLVALRDGSVLPVDAGGAVSAPLAGSPAVVQPGLFDIALAPGFLATGRIWLAYAEADPAGGIALVLAWAKLEDAGLADLKVVHRMPAASLGSVPAGARLAFDGRGHVLLGLDLPAPAIAQATAWPADALLRLRTDGGVPREAAWPAGSGVRPDVHSIGHGRIGALAFDPRTGRLWSVEDIATGAELNQPRPHQRYGDSAAIVLDPFATARPVAQAQPPEHAWPRSPGARGLAFLAGTPGSPWQASAFVAGADGLLRLQLDARDRVTGEEPIELDGVGALADVRAGPDGALYALTDAANGRLLRIVPPRYAPASE